MIEKIGGNPCSIEQTTGIMEGETKQDKRPTCRFMQHRPIEPKRRGVTNSTPFFMAENREMDS